ncbi:AraC family transcriptional regulator [Dyadobacter sp. 676]|uniref:AraC family transcriptional regulator n=1 Tax=Dyadobacter sp. 676 TaxID=3088362 RepID=A0AAU8FIR4_9BACT
MHSFTSEIENVTGKPCQHSNYNLTFVSWIDQVMVHTHDCYKLVASLDHSFNCQIDGKDYKNLNGFIVNQSVSHACEAPRATVLVSFIEPESTWGWKLKSILNDQPFVDLSLLLEKEEISGALPGNYGTLLNEELIPYANEFFDKLFATGDPDRRMDDRIARAVEYINQNLDSTLELDAIADLMCLSPERARHLFVEEMGTPFSQYVLWRRIKETLRAVIVDRSKFTQACLKSGFADQPHFNRVFKRIFGMVPKDLMLYSRILI